MKLNQAVNFATLQLIFSVILIVLALEDVSGRTWETSGQNANIRFNRGCDFSGSDLDLYKKCTCDWNECARWCIDEQQCSHFVHRSNLLGGCYLKRTSEPVLAENNKDDGSVCGFIMGRSRQRPEPDVKSDRTWEISGHNHNIRFAHGCDFSGNDLYQRKLGGWSDCAHWCMDEQQWCTHFSYFRGICYFKRTSDPVLDTFKVDSVCGFIMGRSRQTP